MLKHVFWGALIGGSTGLYSQSPEIDQAVYGYGPFQATDQTAWAMFRNMAGLAAAKDIGFVLGYHIPFHQSELQSLAIGVQIPSKPSLGISYYRTGTESFLNQQVGVSASISVDSFDFGLRIRHWSISISGGGPLNTFSIDGGLQLRINKELIAGIVVGNLSQSKLHHEEILPTYWYTGVKYTTSPELTVMIEFGQMLGGPWEFRTGIAYAIKKKFIARTGFSLSTRRGYFGVGFKQNRLQVDYAIDLHPHLGITQQAGLYFTWP